MDREPLRIKSLNEAKLLIEQLSKQENKVTPQWSLYKILVHCTQTIEFSMVGYPLLKPKIVRQTVGRLAINKFLKQGFMKHSLTAPVAGAPLIADDGDVSEAALGLMGSIDKFVAYTDVLKPHLLFGDLSKEAYDHYFAMHIADHLSELL